MNRAAEACGQVDGSRRDGGCQLSLTINFSGKDCGGASKPSSSTKQMLLLNYVFFKAKVTASGEWRRAPGPMGDALPLPGGAERYCERMAGVGRRSASGSDPNEARRLTNSTLPQIFSDRGPFFSRKPAWPTPVGFGMLGNGRIATRLRAGTVYSPLRLAR